MSKFIPPFEMVRKDFYSTLYILGVMELLKFTNMTPDFCPYSRRINGMHIEVPIDATKKTGKKSSHVVNFIVSMALKLNEPSSSILASIWIFKNWLPF